MPGREVSCQATPPVQPGADRSICRQFSVITHRPLWLPFLLLICVSPAGCGSRKSGPELVALSGVVTLDGKPLQNGILRFLPDVDRQTTGPIATAVLDASGNYSVSSPGGRLGIIPGFHKVTLVCDELPVREVQPGVFVNGDKTCLVPKHFNDESTSGLTAEIPPTDTVLNFDLTTSSVTTAPKR